jgi:hypothetical protein
VPVCDEILEEFRNLQARMCYSKAGLIGLFIVQVTSAKFGLYVRHTVELNQYSANALPSPQLNKFGLYKFGLLTGNMKFNTQHEE